MSLLENLGLFGSSDPRSPREIDDDIVEELRAHLAACEDDLIAEGMSCEEAEREALRRFGDFESTVSACRRVKLGDRIMLLRLNLILMAIVVPVLGYFLVGHWRAGNVLRAELDVARSEQEALMSRLSETEERANQRTTRAISPDVDGQVSPAESVPEAAVPVLDADGWRARFLEEPDSWRHGLAMAYQLARLEGDQPFQILRAIWNDLSVPQREQVFKPFVFDGSPVVLLILNLGATDSEASVRGRAYGYLRKFAFRDFSESPGAYETWWEDNADLPVESVIETNARLLLARLDYLSDGDVARELRLQGKPHLWMEPAAEVDLVRTLRGAGALRLIRRLILAEGGLRSFALEWLPHLEPTEEELRSLVLPLLADAEAAPLAAGALAGSGNTWAVEPLLDHLVESFSATRPGASVSHAARALAEIGEESVIPTLIGMIAADDTYDSVYGVGYFALGQLTGVQYDESHDGAWWLSWWGRNRNRFAPEVAALEVPVFQFDR